jgi:hypothetical protein
MAPLVEQAIAVEEDELGIEYERILKSKGLSMKPSKKEWEPYVTKCEQAVKDAQTPAENQKAAQDLKLVKDAQAEIKVASKKEKAALERIAATQIQPTLAKAFESGLAQTFTAIKTALELSLVDGSRAGKTTALDSLLVKAHQSWAPLVAAKFEIADDDLDY